jgi:hypothetical protein
MRILAVGPVFDDITRFSRLWLDRLEGSLKGYADITDLGAENATRENFEDQVRKLDPNIVVYYDHGSQEGLYAQGGRGYVLDQDNLVLVKGKVIYTLACLSASKLGAVANQVYGCVYVGYVKEFAFTLEEEGLFSRAANTGLIAYVYAEADWKRVKELMIQAFNQAIMEAEDPWSKVWLSWDRDNLRVYATGVDTPSSSCVFRRLVLRILGPKGWLISRALFIGLIAYGLGIGLTLHDLYTEILEGPGDPLRIHGGYVGLGLSLLGVLMILKEYIRLLEYFKHE